jgi:hypothetical protein
MLSAGGVAPQSVILLHSAAVRKKMRNWGTSQREFLGTVLIADDHAVFRLGLVQPFAALKGEISRRNASRKSSSTSKIETCHSRSST